MNPPPLRRQSRASYVGLERGPGKCHVTGVQCIRSDGDCGTCSNLEGVQVEWTCAFCTRRDPQDVTIPGVYKAGACERCQQERILLMAVVR